MTSSSPAVRRPRRLDDDAVPVEASPPDGGRPPDFWSRLRAADNELPEMTQAQQFQALGIGALLAVAVLLLLYWAGLL